MGSISELGRSSREGNVNLLQYILAWRIPWTEEPGGLQSIESQRVRHDWPTKQEQSVTLEMKGIKICIIPVGNTKTQSHALCVWLREKGQVRIKESPKDWGHRSLPQMTKHSTIQQLNESRPSSPPSPPSQSCTSFFPNYLPIKYVWHTPRRLPGRPQSKINNGEEGSRDTVRF